MNSCLDCKGIQTHAATNTHTHTHLILAVSSEHSEVSELQLYGGDLGYRAVWTPLWGVTMPSGQVDV